MYKSRLQELCQQKAWSLPEYSSIKDGPNHNPRFKATVTVNGLSFDTSDRCKSLKEAQNEAAKLAFNHFVLPQPAFHLDFPQPVLPPDKSFADSDIIPSSVSAGSSSESTDLNSIPVTREALLPNMTETFQTPQADSNASGVKDNREFRDIQRLYKNQLQNYAQKRNLALPTYNQESEGPPHASRFKSKVTIDGQTYESPNFFKTVREAEHAAAKVALTSLLPHGVQEDDPVLYKNLLQELAQKEGFRLPMYNTKHNSGLSHNPTFISTVEIEEEVFQGEEGKTKKQAEMNAAKVAYISLKERRTNQSPKSSPGFRMQGASSPFLQLTATVDVQENVRHKAPQTLNSNMIPIEYAKEDEDQEASGMMLHNVEISTDQAPILSPKPETNMSRKRDVPSSEIVYARLRDPFPSAPSSPEGGSSPDSEGPYDLVTDSNIEQQAGTSTFPSNKVRVYPRMQNAKLPAGVIFSDDKWVAVRSDPKQNN